MDKKRKMYLIFGILFSVVAIAFALVYYFGAIRFLDNYLALTYVVYFVGLAIMFAGSYIQNSSAAKIVCFCISIAMITASIIMLVVGLAKGYIDISFRV